MSESAWLLVLWVVYAVGLVTGCVVAERRMKAALRAADAKWGRE